MAKKYVVRPTRDERKTPHGMASAGKGAARKLTHARVLLKADADLQKAVRKAHPSERARRKDAEVFAPTARRGSICSRGKASRSATASGALAARHEAKERDTGLMVLAGRIDQRARPCSREGQLGRR